MPSTREIDREIRDALRFFWAWLLLSSAVSIAGNATHAVMAAPPAATVVAGLVAVVPPVVLLAATHGVAMLVKLRRTSVSLVIAATLTLGLGVLAFILSFDALSDLAQVAGIQPSRAWMWPAAVDGGITLATVAIFGLSRLATPVAETVPSDVVGANVADSVSSDILPMVRPHIAAAPGTAALQVSEVEPQASILPRHLDAQERVSGQIAATVADVEAEPVGEVEQQPRLDKTSTDGPPRRRRGRTVKSTAEPASEAMSEGKPLIRIGSRTSRLTAPV